jgi:hypothetical protein
MIKFAVGDELFKLSQKDLGNFLTDLLRDFVEINKSDEVASSSEGKK